MIKQILLFTVLLSVAGSSFAQQTLFVHDADGARLGEAIEGLASTSILVLTNDGYIMRIDVNSGKFYNFGLSGFRYISNNCSGQAYVSGNTTAAPGVVGGQIVSVENAALTPTFARIEWFPTHHSIYALSSGKPGACNPLDSFLSHVVAATPVEPATYNIKQIGAADEWGFKKPFSMLREKPDVIFCNGYESCPTE